MNSRDDLGNENIGQRPAEDWPQRLIRHAAYHAPADLAERLEEEWLADLDSRTIPLARLRFALGCCYATYRIARDPIAYGAAVAPAAAPAAAAAVAAYGPPPHSAYSGRTIALFFIAGLHVLVILAFSAGLSIPFVNQPPPETIGHVIDPVRPREPEPPEFGPSAGDFVKPWEKFEPQPPELEPIDFSDEPPTPIYTPIGTPSEPVRITRVNGGPGAGFPSTAAHYPALSRQLGEAGAAIVDVCVDTGGRLTDDPRIRESSGYPRLDVAALALARAGSGHYRSATENGQPIASCYPFRVRFSLTK